MAIDYDRKMLINNRKILINSRNKKYIIALKEMKLNEKPLTDAKQVDI